MKKRWPGIVVGLAVSLIALYLLFRRDMSDVRDELEHARYWVVIPTVAVTVLGLYLRALRWRVLLGDRLPLKHSFHILNVSYFINAVLPLRIGELGRAVLAARVDPPVPVLTSLSTVLVERLLDTLAVFALLGITLAMLPVGLEIGVLGMGLGVGAVIGIGVLVVFAARPGWAHALLARMRRFVPPLRRPALDTWLNHLLDGIRPLASPRKALLAVWWTAIAWTASVVSGYILLYAIFDHPTWAAALAMIVLASFVIAVPAVPGNLGPFEAAVVFGLASADLVESATAAPALAFALLVHAVNVASYISLGLIGLWYEDVGLGEVTHAAQMIRTRPQAPADAVPGESAEPARPDAVTETT